MHRIVKGLLMGSGLILSIGLLGTVGFRITVNQRIEQQIAIANQTLSPLVRQGPTQTNHTAQRLNQLLAEIEPHGINDLSDTDFGNTAPSPHNLTFHKALTQYYSDLQQLKAGPIPAVPATIRLGLSERAQTLARIKTLLLENPLPVWAFDASATSTAHTVSAAGFSQAHRLHAQLLALSLLHQQQNNLLKSRKYFLAARKLHDAVIQYPVNGAYSALNMAEQRVIVTRWTAIPEPIISINYGTKLLQSEQYEEALATRTQLQTLQAGGSQANALQAKFKQPLFGLGGQHFLALEHIDFYQTHRQARHQLRKHLKQNNPCTVQQVQLPSLASWNTAFKGSNPDASALTEAVHLQLAAELNTLAAEAHHSYSRTQQWPASLSTSQSQVCESGQWQYEKSAQGITISYGSTNSTGTPENLLENSPENLLENSPENLQQPLNLSATGTALTYSAKGQTSAEGRPPSIALLPRNRPAIAITRQP